MLRTVASSWALFSGMGLLMLGHGLSASLLGIRASLEDFPTALIGFVMTGYSVGFMISAFLVPYLVKRVGHIRVFAAFAALASTGILCHIMIIDPISWFFLRMLNGICMAGIYIVAESWLNTSTDNSQRGSVLSVYMVVQLVFISLGSLLLNLADPADFTLFVLVSIILSVATVPLLLSVNPAPVISTPKALSLKGLYEASPLGFVGMVIVGISQGAVFALAAVYGNLIGLSLLQVSLLVAAISIGGMILQWPIGAISDRFDRRLVLTIVTLLTAMVLVLLNLPVSSNTYIVVIIFGLYGGLSMPLYALCVAHTNDYLEQEQMVGAGATLMFANGIGQMVGPLLIGGLMQVFGAGAYGISLAITHAVLGIFAMYRATQRASIPMEQQSQTILTPTLQTSVSASIVQEEAYEQSNS